MVVRAILAGKSAPLGKLGVASGIFKRPPEARVGVTRAGLEGDEQGDKKHHGGREKALHHYAFEHYDAWRADNPTLAPSLASEGAFGENISTNGLTEADVGVGDVFRLGSALVQISQARQPCWRLNEWLVTRVWHDRSSRRVVPAGTTGFWRREGLRRAIRWSSWTGRPKSGLSSVF